MIIDIFYADIANFWHWFWDSFLDIVNQLAGYLQGIEIFPYVNLLNIIITITILSVFIPILFNSTTKVGEKIGKERKRK